MELRNSNILDCLEKTVEAYPDKTAIIDENRSITYQELRNLALNYANRICGMIEKQQPVMILAEKSCQTLAAMFGIIYAGGFYVNVNPEQPAERIHKILTSLEPAVVLVEEKSLELLKASGVNQTILILEDCASVTKEEEKLLEIRKGMTDSDLLYGIYTSGSTGTPKGIVVSQKAVMQFIQHFTELFEITDQDIIGNQAPFDFDVSVKDIYSTITTGATLVLIPRAYFSNPTRLIDSLCENKVTTLIWAVSALCLISSMKGLDYRIPDQVRKVIFSGEVMPVKQLQRWQKALPETTFVNIYGPTEITCNCTYYKIERSFSSEEKIPIGEPLPGRIILLLDEKKQIITEPGSEGEICVAGESLSEGYYHNPEQTREKFIDYEIEQGNVQKLYCTGDLGYYGETGELYFSGRKDFQIKHMGHRIELEEIERMIMGIGDITRACCVFDEAHNKLIAYYTGTTAPEEVRTLLKAKIPLYMIPNKLIPVEKMPLTKNGKIDRKFFAVKGKE